MNQPLDVIPVKPEMTGSLFEEYLSQENFDFLVQCALHYAGLLGKTIEIPTETAHERICLLYHRFAGILPEEHGLNFEMDEDRLKWMIYRKYAWSINCFYWMPVRFITLLCGDIRETAMSFMHLFIRRNGLYRFRDSYEYDYLFENAEYTISQEEFDNPMNEEQTELLSSYTKGEISRFLDEIYDYRPLDVAAALERYRSANPAEDRLLDCFRKGLEFISGRDSIMNYDYNPDTECFPDEYEDITPVTLDRTVRYIYDLDDFVTAELEILTNQYAQETYVTDPTSYRILHPDSELFEPGDYPERFSQWFPEMFHAIKEITGHQLQILNT